MPFLFTKCSDAIQKANDTRTFGVYYSEAQNQDLSIHVHDCCEILLCLSGGNSFLIDGKPYEV
ncbi:MAG: AraC family transcriptional regulator, partial [Clostridia bacterium]|nr:AraC family transcriptional regulator [Clostridia bacterium]